MASNSSAMATASTAASVANGGGLYHVHHVPHHYQQEPYELSQDLIAKNLEVLEKKYGGSKKAKEAALTIQRAFRRYSMAKKFAHLTAQMKTEKRISRQLEQSNCTVAATLSITHTTSASMAVTSSSISSLQRSSSSGSSSSPHRLQHSSSCRHYKGSDRVDHPSLHSGSSGSPATSQKYHHHYHHNHLLHHSPHNSSQDTDAGNDSSSSNSNQAEVTVGGLQSFPLDESSVYNYHSSSSHGHHHHQPPQHNHSNGQPQQQSSSGGASPSPVSSATAAASVANHKASGMAVQPEASKESLSNVSSPSRSHRRMASAPHVPKRTVSKLTSMENNVNLNNNSTNVKQHQSPSRRVTPVTSQGSGAYYLPDVDMRLTKLPLQYRSVVPSTTSPLPVMTNDGMSNMYTVNEVIRKRHYRTGLNIFNKKPDKGIIYLIQRGFLENSPGAVARFLITRKGLSKQMIGEYLGSINNPFNMAVLTCFAQEMDFSGMHLDTALRKFQTYFRMPGEAQKIERLVEVFSGRYCQCNREMVALLHSSDTVFILAFAIILLNTDLHTPNIKPEKRMKLEDFIRNLRAIDDGHDLDSEMLTGIYERIRNQEFRPGSDHVTQVMKVQQTIVAKCPNLSVPHRRLVCYCRLYEVPDRLKRERPGLHQREVFLFNDLLVITKIHSRKKNSVTYTFRQSYLLAGMVVTLFETPFYPYGIQMAQKWDRKIILTLNARNEHDRSKFVEDLKESIAEMDEMETLRLESELEKQRLSMADNRDSGINEESTTTASSDIVMRSASGATNNSGGNGTVVMRKSAINNSLLDLTDASEKIARRGSVGSLDSGMSISFQSNSIFNNHQCSSQNYHHRSPRVNGESRGPKHNH